MKSKRTTPTGYTRGRELRRNMTPAEKKLWFYLRAHRLKNIHFRSQHPIGPYIADFCATGIRLIIELDGSQHLEQTEYDNERTAYLESQKYKVLRFWNNDVMNDINSVLDAITIEIDGLI